ncbi:MULTISPECIES: phosphoribosyltransferase family protein [Bacillales]|uniref:ComF family protein n=1 Tax=Bacillales TaxID=1385 RepID=UPI00034CBE5E|nr:MULTISPECIES: phosphoribosyltransferase family protein [Bacillales]
MFIEVNELKGLIINLDSFPVESDSEWVNVLNDHKFVFICSDDERKTNVNKHFQQDITFVESKAFIFLKQTLIHDSLLVMGLQPFEVAYVTYSFRDLSTVLSEPVGTILINNSALTFEETGQLPDFRLDYISELPSVFNKQLGGYYSEIVVNIGTPVNESSNGLLLITSLESEHGKFTIVSGGRYYSSKHLKQKTHQLSKRLLKSKEDTTQDDIFSSIFKSLVGFINENIERVDGVTRVPPRPDGRRDRLKPLVSYICQSNQHRDLSENLVCVENYTSQKTLGRDQRYENIRGKFHASSLNGMHVVLIDDILTTGATITECVNTLLKAGASQVTVLVLGINQFDSVAWRSPLKLMCRTEGCNGERFLRIRNDGTSAFFMCSNYSQYKCKGLDYYKGWQEFNSLNALDVDSNQEDEETFYF